MDDRRFVLLIVAAVLAAYATAFGATFQFDDVHVVVANPDIRSWSAWLASLPGIRALTKASYVVSHAYSAAPWSYVFLGVALHAGSATLAFLLVRRWLATLAPERSDTRAAALVAALVFALHPAQTEAVTYIAGRSVVLAGFFVLASLLAFERWRDDPRAASRTWSVAWFALALAARETAWTVPFAILLLELARGRDLRASLRACTPHLVVLAFAGLAVAASPTYRRLLRESLDTRGPLANLYAQVEGIAYLVTRPLLTLRVNFDPDVVAPPSPDAAWWIAAVALAGSAALALALLRRVPWFGVGVLWFLLHLAPTNGVVARYDLVNDRQLYLALLGPALVVGALLGQFRESPVPRIAAWGLALVLGVSTALRNVDYHSEVALWQATVRASPAKSRAWNNLGWALQAQGDRERARAAYARALALDPRNFRARANLEALDDR